MRRSGGIIEIGPSTIDGKLPVECADRQQSSGGFIGNRK
jgi:hypothetical protein